MRKFGIAAVLVAAVLTLGGATLASGHNGAGSDDGHSGQTFTIYAPTA